MTAERDPERWLSADDEVAKQLRPLLRMARGEGPSVSEHARMWNSLVTQLPAAADGSSPAPGTSTSAGKPGWWWIVGTGVVAAAFGFTAALLLMPPASAPRAPDATPVAAAALSQTQPAPQPTASSVPPVIEDTSATESAGREATQSSVPLERPSPARVHSRTRVSSDSPSSQAALGPVSVIVNPQPAAASPDAPAAEVASELELLARARRIVASEPERALQLTAEHARRFPRGVLAQEREVLAIDALFHAGHRDLAVAGARRFIERHPDSAHRVRLAAELEGP